MQMTSQAVIVEGTERPVPRWAERFAHLIPLMALPVSLWRLPIAFGFTMGTGLPPMDMPLWMSISYVGGLSVISELFALACFSLVRRWGETARRRAAPCWDSRVSERKPYPSAVRFEAASPARGFDPYKRSATSSSSRTSRCLRTPTAASLPSSVIWTKPDF